MFDDLDLTAYLRRVKHDGAVAPNLETLRALAIAHAAAIPFENLDPLCGVPVRLEVEALERKLVQEGRGGYCFEHNLLFGAALRTIGYDVAGFIGRVLWNRAEDEITAQTHMLLRVMLDGEPWLADVGFGNVTLTGAVRLQPEVEQPTTLEPFRLQSRGDAWFMQARLGSEWRTLYRFEPSPRAMIDYVVANHYVSTHPESQFVRNLIAARTERDRRITLRNRELTVRRPGLEPERRLLRDTAELCQALRDELRLKLPDRPELMARLDALPE